MVCRFWSKKLYGEDRATSQILALHAGATGQMWIKERRTESCGQNTYMSEDLGLEQSWTRRWPWGIREVVRSLRGQGGRTDVWGGRLCLWGLDPACRCSESAQVGPALASWAWAALSGRDG